VEYIKIEKTDELANNLTFGKSHLEAVHRVLKQNAQHILSIEDAPIEKDLHEATDMIVRVTGGCIALRIRRSHIRFRDMTIRAKCGNAKTELHKLREGFGDWYLYAWSDGAGDFADWWFVDLAILRASGLLDDGRAIKMNEDAYTGFISLQKEELTGVSCLISSKESVNA
jgi:hypothetical protein